MKGVTEMDTERERSLVALEAYFRQRGETPQTAAKLAERMMSSETGDVDEVTGLLESWEAHYRARGLPEEQVTSLARISAYSEMEEAGPGVTETVIPVTEKRTKPKPKDATSHDVVLRELGELGLKGYAK